MKMEESCPKQVENTVGKGEIARYEQTTILNLMKMEESCPKWVENSVGKGEIACYEQFLLFPQCFQQTYTADT